MGANVYKIREILHGQGEELFLGRQGWNEAVMPKVGKSFFLSFPPLLLHLCRRETQHLPAAPKQSAELFFLSVELFFLSAELFEQNAELFNPSAEL